MSTSEIYANVASEVKQRFPEHFGNAKRKQASAVAPAANKGKPSSKKVEYTERDLDDFQREVARKFERSGVMTKEEYIQSLVDTGELIK